MVHASTKTPRMSAPRSLATTAWTMNPNTRPKSRPANVNPASFVAVER